MRILLVSNYQPPHMGGIEFAAQSLKACWERDGHTVTWLTTDLPRGARPGAPDTKALQEGKPDNPKSHGSSDAAARKLMLEDGMREHEPPPITGPDLGDMEM